MTKVAEEKFEKLVQEITDKGFAVIDNFLSISEIESLLNEIQTKFAQGEFKKAGFGRQESYKVNNEIRGDYIHWIDKEELVPQHSYFKKIENLIRYLNRTCYLGIKDYEVHFSIYPKGTHYLRHIDQFKNNSRRKLSIICYLNADWTEKDKGNLKLYVENEMGEETVVNILPIGGRFVCFESSKLEHEVEEAAKERYSITGWMLTEEV